MSRLRNTLAALLLVGGPIFATIPAEAQDAGEQGDPPADVARIAAISGSVSSHQPVAQGQQPDWEAASQNYPLAPGSGVWAEPRSHAAVDVAGARVHLDASSALEVTAINPGQVQLSVPQGAAYIHVYPGVSGVHFEIDTPHGAAHIDQPGQYEVVAGDDQSPSSLTVIEGAAQMVGQSANLALQAGQRGNITPDNQSSVDAAQPDDFVRTVQAEEQPYQQQVAQTAQYVSPQQTGYQDLARYGQWNQDPQYGSVWYPQQVATGWAPYRYGHWAYVAPWGYTWIDDAPWGFTPFHYGRWVEVRNRWAWVPGVRVAAPVYAPALVSFFGNLGGGVGIDVSVGWVPLAPEEVYVPYYRHGPRYVRQVNITNVRNETTIINVVNNKTVINYNNYRNYRGATSASRDVMAGGRAVGPAFGKRDQAHDQQQWAHAKPEQQIPFQPKDNAKHSQGPKNAPQWQSQSKHQTAQPDLQSNAKPNAKQNGKPNGGAPNGQPKWQPQNNAAKPKNGVPSPYIPPTNGNAKQFKAPSGKQQQGGAPDAASNASASPKSGKQNGGAPNGQPKWQPQNNAAKPKNGAPSPYIPPANGNAKQFEAPSPKPGKQANAPDNNKHQQPGVIYPAGAPNTPKHQQEQTAKKAQQQWKQPQSKQQQPKQSAQPNQNRQTEKAPRNNQPQPQQQKPMQNCNVQGGCQQ